MTIYHNNETIRILNSLNNVSIDEFDDRLRLQKVAYLAQKLGSSGGFTFSWYKRGPYSASLTEALYQCDRSGELGKKKKLNSNEIEVINKMHKLLGKKCLDNKKILELYASVWYLLPKWKVTKDTIDSVFKKMKEEKPDYGQSEVKKAIQTVLHFRKQQIVKI